MWQAFALDWLRTSPIGTAWFGNAVKPFIVAQPATGVWRAPFRRALD
jgi:hypothetical protein